MIRLSMPVQINSYKICKAQIWLSKTCCCSATNCKIRQSTAHLSNFYVVCLQNYWSQARFERQNQMTLMTGHWLRRACKLSNVISSYNQNKLEFWERRGIPRRLGMMMNRLPHIAIGNEFEFGIGASFRGSYELQDLAMLANPVIICGSRHLHYTRDIRVMKSQCSATQTRRLPSNHNIVTLCRSHCANQVLVVTMMSLTGHMQTRTFKTGKVFHSKNS